MAYDKPIIQTSNPYKKEGSTTNITRTIYYGEVISIVDKTEGNRIKVRIPSLDNNISNDDLSWSYPLMPKYFHILPQVGEMVRIFIEDTKYTQRSRFWIGSIISQPQKIKFDSSITALATTNLGNTKPDPAPSTFPDAKGVYPEQEDIAIVGRVNTDIILKVNELHLRTGKHENDNELKLNVKNPSTITMVFEPLDSTVEIPIFQSRTLIMSDKIGLISHSGNPKFKAVKINSDDRDTIFKNAHPIARGDVLVEALNILRKAIINHIHGYASLSADKNILIENLEKIDFDAILQKNIVIN